MNNITNVKGSALAAIGAVGAIIINLLGGWSLGLETLLILIIVDYFTGLISAAVFHKSKKTETGALSSNAGFRGIFKKVMYLLLVLVAHRVDLMLGFDYIRDGVIVALCLNEIVSFIEILGLIGVPIPDIIKNAIDLLKKKGEVNVNSNR